MATALRMPKSIGFSVWLIAGTSLITSAQKAKMARNVSSVTPTTAQRRRTKVRQLGALPVGQPRRCQTHDRQHGGDASRRSWE